jgi:hypothetical protein
VSAFAPPGTFAARIANSHSDQRRPIQQGIEAVPSVRHCPSGAAMLTFRSGDVGQDKMKFHKGIHVRSHTQVALVLFFGAAAVLCMAAGFTMIFPDTALSAIWSIKPQEFAQLLELRPWTSIGFLLLSGGMGLTAWGCLNGSLWGWRMAIAIFAANGLGDAAQIFAGRVLEGFIGIAVVVAIVFWLTRPQVKAAFQ